MSNPTILVAGAAGRTASAVVAQLREKGFPVRATVRAQDARSDQLRRLGAEVVVADLFDPEQMLAAMHGAARAYYCAPFHPHMLHSAMAFAVAARQARLEAVVALTQWLASPSHPSLPSRQHWLADQVFAILPGVAHTAVNPGFFASSPYLQMLKYAALLGVFPMPADGAGRNAPPSDEDIARVALAALIDPARHAGRTYRPTGPELLSVTQMVAIMGRVLGRTVRHVKLPMWMFHKAAGRDGANPALLHGMRHYLDEHDGGAFAFGAPTTDVFDLTGRQPEDFATIVRRHAARPELQPTLRNRIRAFAEFMAVPFAPGFDPKAYERAIAMPLPAAPRLALQDPAWVAAHAAQTGAPAIRKLAA